MSVRMIQSKCGLFLTCLLGQIMLFAAPVQAGVEGKSYTVSVNSSLGDNFTACFQFNSNGTLRFLGQNATYTTSNGNNQATWRAVTPPSALVSIALNGQVIGDFVSAPGISGSGMNSNGTTFTLNGTLLPSPTCPLSPSNLQFGGSRENPFLK